MFDFLIQVLEELSYFVGYIKNNAYPEPLNEDDEQYYLNQLLNHKDNNAREKLIHHNLRLVVHVCKKYDTKLDNLEELISIGTIGLIKAVDSYSLDKGVHLATYAARCIENEVLMHLRSNKKYNNNVSLFDAIGQDKDGSVVTLIDVVPNNEIPINIQIDKKDKIKKLEKYLTKLDQRELEIISLRYGLFNKEELTQKEIASKYNISRSYVSRIEKRALTKLLQEFRKEN